MFLIFVAKMLIDGSLKIEEFFNVSERIIAISVIAFGTSLPELATALVAVFRKEEEIIVGTIIGSNIFNPLLVTFVATLIRPIVFSKKMLFIDFPIMVGFSILLWILMILGKDRLSRADGLILLFSYFSYIIFVFSTA